MHKLYVFWHIYISDTDQRRRSTAMNIIRRQHKRLSDSGLVAAVEKVYIGYVSRSAFPCEEILANPKFEIAAVAESGNERITTSLMHTWCNTPEADGAAVLYMHNKGESHPEHAPAHSWAKACEYFTIDRYRDAVGRLSTYETAGPFLVGHHLSYYNNCAIWHYSGNFWWAKASYIRSIPPPRTGRHSCGELWVIATHGIHIPKHIAFPLYVDAYHRCLYSRHIDEHEYMHYEDVISKGIQPKVDPNERCRVTKPPIGSAFIFSLERD